MKVDLAQTLRRITVERRSYVFLLLHISRCHSVYYKNELASLTLALGMWLYSAGKKSQNSTHSFPFWVISFVWCMCVSHCFYFSYAFCMQICICFSMCSDYVVAFESKREIKSNQALAACKWKYIYSYEFMHEWSEVNILLHVWAFKAYTF